MADSKNSINYKITIDTGSGTASIRDLKGQIVATQVPIEQLRARFGNFAKTVNSSDFNKFNKGLKASTAQLQNAHQQTGAATSATLEFGRVLSDAPYGIRGVANNLQQLASNLFFMSKGVDSATGKTIGFGGAIGSLLKNLAGPAGILVAFQGITAALDYFYGTAGKSEKAVSELTSETYASSLVAKGYVEELENVNISENRRTVVTQELIKLVPTLTEADLKYGENLDKVRLKIQSYALAQASRIEIDNLVQENSEVLASKNELESIKQIENSEDRLSRMKKFVLETGKEVSGFYLGFGQEALINKGNIDATEEEFIRLGEIIDKQSTPIIKRIEELTKSLELDPSKTKGKVKKRKKVAAFDTSQISKDAKNYVDEVMKMEKKNALLLATNNVDKLIIERDFQLKRLSLLKGDNSALISEYTKYYDTLIKTAEEKLLGEGKIDPKKPATTGDAKETAKEKFLAGLEAYMEVQQSFTSFMDGEFSRQLTIEQNKTNALNNQLNERLLNENLSKDERERIQLQIGQNDEKLRKKQEQIEKKRFKLNKAANIAQATISTYLAGVKVLADPAFTGRPFARIAAMTATIAAGLLSVATIARTKFQSSAGSGGSIGPAGGGAGGEGESREFNFNLAGSTQSNQLTQSIAGQLSQPIQTYVVSSEITSQQQLDLSISNTASLG